MKMLSLPRSYGRHRTRDTAFQFRMGAGFGGDVNRGHPASIQACLVDPVAPPQFYGEAVLIATASQGAREVAAGDSALTNIWGVTVRPYPIQQQSATAYGAIAYGAGVPPSQQPIDILTAGYILVPVVGSPVKGGAVFVWYGATGAGHTLGGFEAASGASTMALDTGRYKWNSPPDANGIAELSITL